jgi:hypothetical protein
VLRFELYRSVFTVEREFRALLKTTRITQVCIYIYIYIYIYI